eukprot:CAMPEP_0183325782 /NCGR_PEP_ID=MMETSP0160_2-20130417/80450_1 /TAXON_ID=2839 ORGANISM="Odontella Sinensis, Strain Grunow 1884" /NCGR_SAMPLE_ID=MMETSP0160_2 /ASSEMBLY_ACC=CAM_ASM_000250 /LENGTH=311 /DNA_ID=CAMNT_0025493635 /DNA_START=195 /DNA_END=1130 /DNA_ORIENTATION=+
MATSDADAGGVIPGDPTWHGTTLRIADPSKSIPFYVETLGMTLLDQTDDADGATTTYHLTTLPDGAAPYDCAPGSEEASEFLATYGGVTLKLRHKHGTEKEGGEFGGYHPGNKERDGFGHIAVSCDDVYASCERLEKSGVTFKKKPDEGRMKGLAFAYDPDGYWVEIVRRGTKGKISKEFNLSQTMLRVKDPKKSIPFYRRLGMSLMTERHFGDFSLYFMACGSPEPEDPTSEEATAAVRDLFPPVLELTHNHGTEEDAEFAHYNGNEEGREGFGGLVFRCDDIVGACNALGFEGDKGEGTDPDGYRVVIQ